jgi:hypothetical protein
VGLEPADEAIVIGAPGDIARLSQLFHPEENPEGSASGETGGTG